MSGEDEQAVPTVERVPELAPFLDRAGRFVKWPVKRRMQLLALGELRLRFDPGVRYTEKQVNAVLNDWHTFGDAARLRRDLVDLGWLERTSDGRQYWLAEVPAEWETGS